jgi:peptidoglycan/LPS O-acetylase OafA/YrhL
MFAAHVGTHGFRTGTHGFMDIISFNFLPWHLLFLYGASVAWIARRGAIPYPLLLAISGIVIFGGSALYEGYYALPIDSLILMQLYGIGATLGVAGFVELERQGSISVSSPLVFLGDASYSIYLIHSLVLSAMAKVIVTVRPLKELPVGAAFSGMLAIALLVGIAFHVIVEKRILRWCASPRELVRVAA